MVRATLNGAYDIVLPKHRADRPEWYSDEGWEKARMAALVDCIRTQGNPVVYYVGAEEGDLAAVCAMNGAEMVLFEPNPEAWPNIRAIWEANTLTRPLCFQGFASNQNSADAVLDCYGYKWPNSAYDEVRGDHGFKELWLERDNYSQITLDKLVEITKQPPTIITFDVEGSEWQVLRGAEQTLREHKPVLFASIHPEFMFHQWGEYSADFRAWIKAFGYRETILDYQHELHCMYEPA